MIVYKDQKHFIEAEIKLEKQLEEDVVKNAKLFFGNNSIYIDAKKKLDSKSLGGCIPDGFLFNLSDEDNPEFYVVEVELAKHDFYSHIFPQFTKFFGFFRTPKNKGELIEKLFDIIKNDNVLQKEFKKHVRDNEIYKFIKDTIDESQNILLIIDGEKSELPDIMNTYNDTWGKFVKILVLKKFICGNESLFTMEPEFENIDYSYVNKAIDEKQDAVIEYDEDYHLSNVSLDINNTYKLIKEEIIQYNSNVKFNCRKYYIAIALNHNISLFQFSKKKIRLVVMENEDSVKNKIKKHNIIHLSEGVQKFWGSDCCEIELSNSNDINEVVELIKELTKTDSAL